MCGGRQLAQMVRRKSSGTSGARLLRGCRKCCLCNGAKAGAKQWGELLVSQERAACVTEPLVPQERASMWVSPQDHENGHGQRSLAVHHLANSVPVCAASSCRG
jgi:hypothetical protein